LIVEDNELDSSQIAKMLDNGEEINIEIAATGKEALELDQKKDTIVSL
jgi:CheY-like chemotaxis protein